MLLSGYSNRNITDVLRGVVEPVTKGAGTTGFTSSILSNVASGTASAVGVSGAALGSVAGLVPGGGGTTTFDGVEVCRWIVPWLQEARKRGWQGTVTSGHRSIERQKQACINVCGNPNGCPGRCAAPGTSNHQGCGGGKGAIDVTDHETFARIMKEIRAPLKNSLPATDPIHFSRSGK